MNSIKSAAVILGLTAMALTGCGTESPMAGKTTLKATLSGAQEVPATTSQGTGTGTFNYDPATKLLQYSVSYSGLTGPATAAHIHGPAAPGVNAGVMVPFQNVAASPITDLYISVQNSLGQEVSRTTFGGSPPGTVFLLDGTGYVNIPAGSSLTFTVPEVLVPAALAGTTNVNFVAVLGQIYNQFETPNQTRSGPLSGTMFSTSLALPAYYGTATTDHSGYANTQPIVISGQAISQSTGLPVSDTDLLIGFELPGPCALNWRDGDMRRTISLIPQRKLALFIRPSATKKRHLR